MIDEIRKKSGDSLFLERTFNALPEQVFSAWTKPELLKQWWGPPGTTVVVAEVDLQIGGRYRFGIERDGQARYFVHGTYQVIEPAYKLVFTWRWENPEMDIGESLVTIVMDVFGNQTRLQLTHTQLPEEAQGHHYEGWVGILEKLTMFCDLSI